MPGQTAGITPSNCPFCAYAAERRLPHVNPALVAYRNDVAIAFPSLHQRVANRGHFLVAPAAHHPDIYRLPPENYAGLLTAVAVVARAVRHAFDATGVTLIQNNEWDGGQDVFHMHIHVVPRRRDDGFSRGDGRWPYGLEVVPEERRLIQTAQVRANLGAPVPALPQDVDTDG
ncbi:MAG: HIT family protein [Chloroflexi bacterium]|nr:MAG: HIT family protein [Chloroflexota bacterium]